MLTVTAAIRKGNGSLEPAWPKTNYLKCYQSWRLTSMGMRTLGFSDLNTFLVSDF